MRLAAILSLLLSSSFAAHGAEGFILKADEPVPNDGGSFSTPALLVNCDAGALTAAVRWDFAVATGQVAGSYRFDDGDAVGVTWPMSADGSMSVIAQPDAFLDQLADKKKLRVDVMPGGESIAAVFSLAGQEKNLTAARAACGQ